MSLNSKTVSINIRTSSGSTVSNMRHQLVGAQVEVLRMYLEKQSRQRLLEALDRLIECTQASFREEEVLMEMFASAPDSAHRDKHNEVLAQMNLLRSNVLDCDRGRLLAQLILVDRQLTSHISDALRLPNSPQPDLLVERETAAA